MTFPQAIIFDLDGTLVHSVPDMHVALNAALTSQDRSALNLATVVGFVGNGVERLVERAVAATGASDAIVARAVLEKFLAVYAQTPSELTEPYAGVWDQLDALRDAGVALGICTNKPQDLARRICDDIGLTPYFGVVSGAVSGQPKKPDPAPLLAVVAALGAEPARTIYVGDSTIDFETSRAARLEFRLFTQGYLNGAMPALEASKCFDDWRDVSFHI